MSRISDYSTLPVEAHLSILAGLVGSVNTLLSKIAPKGYQDSPYYFYFHNTLENEYEFYRRIRVIEYKRARNEGKEYVVTPMLTFEQWLETGFSPRPAILPDEPIAMLLDIFLLLTGEGIVFSRNSGVYNFSPEEDRDKGELERLILKAIAAAGMEVASDFRFSRYQRHPYRRAGKMSYTEIYRHIFEFLLSQGLEFYHQDTYLQFVINLQRELSAKQKDDEMGHFEMIANFLRLDDPDEDNPNGGYPDFSSAFTTVSNGKPREELMIYKEVYKS